MARSPEGGVARFLRDWKLHHYAVLVVACACSTSTAGTEMGPVANGCATTVATWYDAGPLPCPVSLADFCAQAPSCPPATWAQAVALQSSTGWPRALFECDHYNYADPGWACGDTTSVLFAYDSATGEQLAATELASPGAAKQTCLAGPTSIEVVGHCVAVVSCFSNDAGLDAGPCADAGAPSADAAAPD